MCLNVLWTACSQGHLRAQLPGAAVASTRTQHPCAAALLPCCHQVSARACKLLKKQVIVN